VQPIEFKPEKFRQLILYVATASEDDPRFGATKLNKLLYFSDFEAFGLFGAPITGATYQKLDRGPAPREILPVLQQMEAEGSIQREERRYFHLRQKCVVPTEQPDTSVFEPREVELVDLVLRELRDRDASQVRALSHLDLNWQLAEPGKSISYATAYISDRRPTASEIRRYQEEQDDRGRRHVAGG
jgi:Protein of unknown function (DUF4065)